MKLWQKEQSTLNRAVEKFTVGKDYLLDSRLVRYDCIASIAHAKMLNKIGIITKKELNTAIFGLEEIIGLNNKGKFLINREDEDCHTAIENYLTKKCGGVGKKIHTLRSRNDQVLTTLRLYEKDELLGVKEDLFQYKKSLEVPIKEYGKIGIPGYTHTRKAMPTTIDTWMGAFVDSTDDNLALLETTFKLIDQSPLGTAAGFGVPVFEIDRKMTSELMGFSRVQENPIYAQMSRGKFESEIVHLMSQIMFDLNKLSTDLILFSMPEFGYLSLPEEFCTGSSIMPQKKNPDVLELVRASYNIVIGEEYKIKSLVGNLISGYNRDLQLTKEPLFNSIDITKDSLEMMTLLLPQIRVNKNNCRKAMTQEIYATEEAYKLVKEGMPFREAYRKIGKKYTKCKK